MARALAIAHTCMYDAWSVYDVSAAATLGDTPRRPASERTDADKAKAISYAAYNCLLNLFPAGASRLAAVMTGLGYDPNDKSTDLTTPQGIGNVAAAGSSTSAAMMGRIRMAILAPAGCLIRITPDTHHAIRRCRFARRRPLDPARRISPIPCTGSP